MHRHIRAPKVGLLTFHFNCNYGAILQTLATTRVLQQSGCEVCIPNFVPDYIAKPQSLIRAVFRIGIRSLATEYLTPSSVASRLQNAVRGKLNRTEIKERSARFAEFRKQHLPISAPINGLQQLQDLSKEWDAVVVGSDQVWNLRFMRRSGFDPYYFLGFLPAASRTRRIGYAPCFGNADQPNRLLDEARPFIRTFDKIMVRNRFSANLVEQSIGTRPTTVVDPTMLYDFQEFAQPTEPPIPYIAVYLIDKSTQSLCNSVLRKIREKHPEYRVIAITSEYPFSVPSADQTLSTAGPSEWVKLIANASFVVTDSFHGCVFAQKFSKPLIAVSTGWRASRIHEFLSHFGRSECSVSSIDDAAHLDFAAIESVRQESKTQMDAESDFSKKLLLTATHGDSYE